MQTPAPRVLSLPVAVAALCWALAGCTPKIGDSCQYSTNCASDGTRICDTSEPGGYCTVLSCTGNSLGSVCPDNAVCILFNPSVPGCPFSAYAPARTSEAQCRNTCGSDSDCRAGYLCADPKDTPWNAEVLDPNQSVQVCLPALSNVDGGESPLAYGYDGSPDAVPAVCRASGPTFDAGFPPVVDAAPDAAGDAADAAADATDAADAGTDAEAGVDAAVDSMADSGVDATVDSGVDATVDSGVDATVDSGVDATVDSGVDATLDAGSDAPADGAADVGADAPGDASPSDSGSADAGLDAADAQPPKDAAEAG